MYLLKRYEPAVQRFDKKFTFHYVSIKTVCQKQLRQQLQHLHSTMYLLKQQDNLQYS